MIKIGIYGYGNLGRGVENAVTQCPDMELVGVFTRRDPKTVQAKAPVYRAEDALSMQDKIDVMILCGGKPERPVCRLFHMDHSEQEGAAACV